MFGKLFRRRPSPTIAIQPVGEVFSWLQGVVLKPLDRLTLALPAALLDPDQPIGSAINCDDDAEFAMPEGDDKIYLRLRAGTKISLRQSV